ncbi:tyrosine-type recombinase/integrase [Paraburkholderia sp. UCT31]|uniref:tyrosine-type recombinase/integrase n=1 Tax=Paraburkholderia sp. UCT31 TaxID=2615209 RepID=UPI001654F856|nr:tyrosine-type recombinase/integrase [Paraburkholderia sp. UCT31]MBC8737565.1 tyrosine-type recombinase/integrase [Paraburkholderia sp. UCT31]
MAQTINFTKESIGALPTPATRAEYADGGGRASVNGLLLRVTPTGVKSFCVLKRIKGGKLERFTLGRFPDLTVEQARRKATDVLSTVASGDNPAEVRRALKGELTFAQMFDEYKRRHAQANKRTWREDVQRFEDYLEAPIGRKKLSKVERRDIRAIHEGITKEGHATTANRVLSLISSVFGKAIEWEYAEANPATGIKPNKERSRDRFIQSDELPRFFASLSQEPNGTMRDFFLVALLTGARRSNVAAMQWTDVSFERAEWRIERTKNDDPQTVALSPEALQILVERREGSKSEFVFPGDGKRGHMVEPKSGWLRIFDRDELTQLIARIEAAGGMFEGKDGESIARSLTRARAQAELMKLRTEGARIPDLRIHDLRRTLGSWQAAAGASLAVIGKSLNHRTVTATAIYARLNLDPVRESVTRATSAMMAAVGDAADVLPFKQRGVK